MNPQTSKEITGQTSSSEVDGTSPSTFDTMKHEQAVTTRKYLSDPMLKNEQTIDIPDTASNASLPCVLEINREDYLNLGVPLYEASIMGDWETAKLIFDKRPDMVRIGICKNLGTALHVAVTANETKQSLHFVKELVNMMTMEDLELRNKYSNTAFYVACLFGSTEMAKILMEKNPNLLSIRGVGGALPLAASALTGRYNLVKHLYHHSHKMTGDYWTNDDRSFILLQCVERDFYDIALQIVNDRPELAHINNVSEVLEVLARKPDALNNVENNLITRIIKSTFRFFQMKLQPVAEEDTDALKLLKHIWGHATRTMNLVEIQDMLKGPPRMLFVAAEMGNTRFIVELLRTYPDLMYNTNEDGLPEDYGLTIFHIAVMRRHQGIYNLLYEIGKSNNDVCIVRDMSTDNNMLHLVGKTSKEMAAKTPGASLLMQRELLWFKEVEKMMPPYMREEKNNDGLTPYELFSKENEDQVSKELKWTKDCMVVTTLIVTVAFAAAFTVPGGYKGENGLPFFIHQPALLVFVIADAICLFSSSTSLLVFLSILTSRHGQRDFMYSLPTKLMMGLLALLISVAAMMVTFSASFFVLYDKELNWVPLLITAFTAVPVIVFAVLQSPLLVDIFRSMYDSHYLFNPKKRVLYTTKPPRSRSVKSSFKSS